MAFATWRADRPGRTTPPEAPVSPAGGFLRTAAAAAGGLAIASVPVFSANPGLSFVPQILAFCAVVLAGLTLFSRWPRVHVAVVAYLALVFFWGWILIWDTGVWEDYRTLLKIALLALAAHVIYREKNHLLLLFGMFCATGLVTLSLNWDELRHLGSAIGSSDILADKDRFAGTFSNANAAGMYGVTVLLSGLLVWFNTRSWVRWPLLLVGLITGASACYFSGSRKAMLGLGVVALAVPWMAAFNSSTGRVNWTRTAALTVVAVGLGILAIGNLPFADRLLVTLTEGVGMESSSRQRVELLVRALELWTDYPVFGCGFDGFSRLSGFGIYSHTTFGEVLCNGGLFGFSLLAVFYCVPPAHLAGMVRNRIEPASSRLAVGLLTFWALFTLFSCFAVVLDSREYLALYAALCGYVQEWRSRQMHHLLVRERRNQENRVASPGLPLPCGGPELGSR